MSDQATERVFQNDIINQMLTNGWQLGRPEKYHRELALYPEELIGQPVLVINLLQERRPALISAAVTGKIDVRDWKIPEANQQGVAL
jgi:hypothetical protein